MAELDLHVTFYVRQELYSGEWRRWLAQQNTDDEAAIRALGEADRLEGEVRKLAARLGEGGVSAETVATAEAAARPKIDALRKQAAGNIAGIPEPDDVLAMWETADLHWRRQAIGWVCERIALYKAPKRGKQPWTGKRVGFVFRDQPGKEQIYPAVIRAKLDTATWARLMRAHGGRGSFVASAEELPDEALGIAAADLLSRRVIIRDYPLTAPLKSEKDTGGSGLHCDL